MDLPDSIALLESDPDLDYVSVDATRPQVNNEDFFVEPTPLFHWYPNVVNAIERHPRLSSVRLIGFHFDGGQGLANRRRRINNNVVDANGINNPLHIEDAIRFRRGGEGAVPRGSPAATAAADRLFGAVLPRHATIDGIIIIENCRGITSRHTQSFFEALLSSDRELRGLYFAFCRLEPESFRHIASALRRQARLQTLCLLSCRGWSSDPGLFPSVCEAAVLNRHLVSLSLTGIPLAHEDDGDRWTKEALRHLVGTTSMLQELHLSSSSNDDSNGGSNGWAPGFFEGMVQSLRTNVNLESLSCRGVDLTVTNGLDELLHELLTTFNFTLRQLDLGQAHDDDHLHEAHNRLVLQVLARNGTIRTAYARLCDEGVPSLSSRCGECGYEWNDDVKDDRHSSAPFWPEAIARINPFPTLLYRFLRKNSGNAVSLVDYLQKVGQTSRTSASEWGKDRHLAI